MMAIDKKRKKEAVGVLRFLCKVGSAGKEEIIDVGTLLSHELSTVLREVLILLEYMRIPECYVWDYCILWYLAVGL